MKVVKFGGSSLASATQLKKMKPVNTLSSLLQGNEILRIQKLQMPSLSITKNIPTEKILVKVKNGLSIAIVLLQRS